MDKSNKPVVLGVLSGEEILSAHLTALASSYEREGGFPCRVNRVHRMGGWEGEAPDIVLIDLDTKTDELLEEIPHFREQGGRSWIAVTYRQPSSERLLKAMRSGANDYLPFSPTMAEFGDLLARSMNGLGATHKPPGQLISVFSSKGGVGTTTVAINVAASLAAQFRNPSSVVLVDLVLQHGDVPVFLDVPTKHTVANLVVELDRADSNYLLSVLPKHRSGVHVLPSPYAPDESDLVNAVQISRLLQVLSSVFDALVVDAGHELTDSVLTALEASHRIFIVASPSLPSIRNTRRSLDLFTRLGYDSSKLVLILNRHDAEGNLDQEAIEEALGRKIQWSIPNDYKAVVQATNQGTAIRTIDPKGPVASNIDRLVATHILGRNRPVIHAHSSPTLISRGLTEMRHLWEKRPSHGTP